jgi:hypothetical protein
MTTSEELQLPVVVGGTSTLVAIWNLQNRVNGDVRNANNF